MQAIVHSVAAGAWEALPVVVECRLSRGLPNLIIVGFASRAVAESRERLRGAFAASGLPLPPQRIVLNLAPADLPKNSTGLDAAMAAAILLATQPTCHLPANAIVLGELSLSGELKPIRGLIASLLSAQARGFTTAFLPACQSRQAVLIPGLKVIPLQSLAELQRAMSGSFHPSAATPYPLVEEDAAPVMDLARISGQAPAKRVLEIAAAGGHNLLLSGPPGTGKSLLAKALPGLLPPLSHTELVEVNQLHGLAQPLEKLLLRPPCRAPHHSATLSALIGGGPRLLPGEASLSHRGVLLLDELPEFNRQALEALRQPLEDKYITVANVHGSQRLPADFLLVATANPCPCGLYGTPGCRCPQHRVLAYQQKLSGPLLDRIDLYLGIDGVDHASLLRGGGEPSSQVRQRVSQARQATRPRLGKSAKALLDRAGSQLGLSARAYMRSLKVADTIARLELSEVITPAHISEALQYRRR